MKRQLTKLTRAISQDKSGPSKMRKVRLSNGRNIRFCVKTFNSIDTICFKILLRSSLVNCRVQSVHHFTFEVFNQDQANSSKFPGNTRRIWCVISWDGQILNRIELSLSVRPWEYINSSIKVDLLQPDMES